MKSYRLQELAQLLDAELQGNPDHSGGAGLAIPLQHAGAGQVALASAAYRKQLATTAPQPYC